MTELEELAQYHNELWNAQADLLNAAQRMDADAAKMREQAERIRLIIDPPTRTKEASE